MDHEERLKAALADRYQIEREIGSGGMATVYLAEDLRQAELDSVGGGDIAAARHTNHLRLAVDWARMQYDRLADQPQLVGAFWQDLLTSLHLLGAHQTELEYALRNGARAMESEPWRALRRSTGPVI